MGRILAFTGKKQAGKSSGAKFVVGQVMMQQNIIQAKSFSQDKFGDLIFKMSDGALVGPLDINSKSPDFMMWCQDNLWPHVKVFSFADKLKWSVVHIFGIDESLVFGSEKDKATETHIKWDDLKKFMSTVEIGNLKKSDKHGKNLTVRELLQEFGTRVCRTMDDDCWIRGTMRSIDQLDSRYSVIDDLRFNNEAKAVKKKGGLIIRCEGGLQDEHSSEVGIDDKYVDFTVSKDKNTLDSKNLCIREFLIENSFFERAV
jgi:hypothetical protein